MVTRARTARARQAASALLRDGRRSRGQSLAELALLLPVLLMIMLGAIDFGRAYFAYVSVTNGAQNGAHYASAGPLYASDLTGIKNAVLADTSDLVNTSATNPDVAASSGTDGQGNMFVDVTVTYQFEPIFPWPGVPGSFDIGRTVRARVP
jgi:Flp pilus assembly protein TadG